MPQKPLHNTEPISMLQALLIAQSHVCQEIFGNSPRVVDGSDAVVRAFNVRTDDAWVVFKHNPGNFLQSSQIIVISKRTGQVIYDGSAQDEG
jgi:hypothetical protein